MTCPSCGHRVPEGARFCPACGRSLARPLGEERRIVTVVFADLVGFTTLARDRDPEQVKILVDSCFQRLVGDVTAFGGRVDKIVGDAIIALFGAPIAHEDDAERAVRAALRMQETVETYARERRADVKLRIGVNTGEVLVGALRAGGDYTAMGDVVNVAARLEAAAPPGGVVVGAPTHAATDGAIRYVPLGPLEARGREPVDAWQAIEAVAPPGRRPRRVRAPLVGRETETALLLDGITLAATYWRPIVAVVEGEGGVGKNRLVDEVANSARGTVGALVLEGRCVPYGESNAWYPIATAVGGFAGIDPAASADENRQRAREVLARLHQREPDDKAVTALVEGLLHLAGLPSTLDRIEPARAREELSRSVVGVLDAVARTRPVVLVVSDLQWADPVVLGLLETLLARLGGLPFALLTTLRPDGEAAWSPPPGRHNSLLLRLDPLARPAADRLVHLLLGPDVPVAVRDDLFERSGGNPFFLEELASLVSGTRLPDALPSTLRGLVAARLDVLPPAQRAMLDNAAVLGSSGTWGSLARFAEAMGQPPDPAALDALAEAELLDVDGTQWCFRSESVREVAYATLTKSARAQRHAGVARGFEDVHGDRPERAEQIGFHWAAAADLVRELGPVPGVPDDVVDRAVAHLAVAASWSLEQEVLGTAVRLASRALDLLDGTPPTDPTVRRLLLVRGEAFQEQREVVAATADAASALDGAERAGDMNGVAHARLLLGEIERAAGHLDASATELARAAGLFEELGDRGGLAEALRAWGMTSIFAANYDAAERHLAEADALFAELGDRRGQAWVDQHRAWVSFQRGDVTEAERRLLKAGATFTDLDDRGGSAWVNGLLGFVRYQQGRRDEAETLAIDTAAEARERGDRWAEAMMRTLLAGVRLWSGRPEEAVAMAEEARRGFDALGDGYGRVQALAPLTRGLVALGRVGEALRLLDEAKGVGAPFGLEGFTELLVACVAYHAGDGQRCVAAGEHTRRMVEHGGLGFDAQVAYALGLLQSGRALEARAELDELGPVTVPHPHLDGARGLVLTACGEPAAGLELAQRALDSTAATYLDRVVAGCAAALAAARLGRGDEARRAIDDAVGVADTAHDVIARAVARTARASVLELLHDDGADEAALQASTARAHLEGGAAGWVTAVELAARGGVAPTPAPSPA